MSSAELEAFLTYLAVKEQVAASAQNQALKAVIISMKVGYSGR